MDAQTSASLPGRLHRPATQLEQASTDVLEKKMTRNLDHLMATHAIASDLRKAGKPIWKHKIRVVLTGLDSFEQKRDEWVNALRASAWIKSMDDFDQVREAVEELAETTDADEFDYILSDIYDVADIERTWIGVQH